MWGTVLVYGTLLAIIVVLYYLSKSSQKDGWSRNLLKKLGMGLPAGQTAASKQVAAREMEADVERVLQEIYEDFHAQLKTFRTDVDSAIELMNRQFVERIAALEQEVQSLKASSAGVPRAGTEERAIDTPEFDPVVSAATEVGQDLHEPNYFHILDRIQQGVAIERIAVELDVELEQVRLVKKLMTSPQG